MNRIAKFAGFTVAAIALSVAWRTGVFDNPQQKETKALEALAKEYRIENYYVKEGLFRDRVELSTRFKEVEQEVARLATEELKLSGIKGRGAAYHHGQIKKRILKERHGIEWRPIEEMNPFVIFD